MQINVCSYCLLPSHFRPSNHPNFLPSSSLLRRLPLYRCQYQPCWPTVVPSLVPFFGSYFDIKANQLPQESLLVCLHFIAILGRQDLFSFRRDTCIDGWFPLLALPILLFLGWVCSTLLRVLPLLLDLFGLIPCIWESVVPLQWSSIARLTHESEESENPWWIVFDHFPLWFYLSSCIDFIWPSSPSWQG